MPQVYTGDDYPLLEDRLSSGQETVPRGLADTSVTLTSGVLTCVHFAARKADLSTQVRLCTTATAAGATPTLCRIGLYTWALDPLTRLFTATLVASTPNDTDLFAAASTAYTKAWSSSYRVLEGQRYALGALVVTGAAAPTLASALSPGPSEAAQAPRLNSSVPAQSDLPASFTENTLTTLAARLYGVVLP